MKIQNNELLTEFLVGSILGDGTIEKSPIANYYRMRIAHCDKQYNYLNYKHKFLTKFNAVGQINNSSQLDSRTKKLYLSHKISTGYIPILKDIYDKFYIHSKNKKRKAILDEVFLKKYLTPFAIAIWFMDDGTTSGKYGLLFCTDCYSEIECLFLIKTIKELYDINLTYHKSCHGLYIGKDEVSKFQKLILPYMEVDMLYKLRINKGVL